jgi:GDP/UDP-N,N'-diacetylbacillosamine 2-epimerase (hydrolysing)
MKLALLTSSRADYGFYRPLIRRLSEHEDISFTLVAFGAHLSKLHGYTISKIYEDGVANVELVKWVPNGDGPAEIAEGIGSCHVAFSKFWTKTDVDLVICIGDRYEMFAAVSASIPFNIPVAHISGGEETLGAIDNIYRHSLTHMSRYHFVNTQKNKKRVIELVGNSKNVVHSGSLAVDNIHQTALLNTSEFYEQFAFDITSPFILFTFHPETAKHDNNKLYAEVIESILLGLNYNVLVTMPNADTSSSIIRDKLIKVGSKAQRISLVESLGSRGYYTALKNCEFVLGNSSSGLIEAASFGKYVINLGSRQKGREKGKNIIDCKIDEQSILSSIRRIWRMPKLDCENIYGDGNARNIIVDTLRNITINELRKALN